MKESKFVKTKIFAGYAILIAVCVLSVGYVYRTVVRFSTPDGSYSLLHTKRSVAGQTLYHLYQAESYGQLMIAGYQSYESRYKRELRTVRGLIDSNDLPLNVSREILQDSSVTRNLRTALTKRALQMLDKLAKDDAEKYQTFWKQFGLVLKEGPAEDPSNQEAIAKLLRFATTHTDSSAQTVSLEEYVSRMKEGQEKIYYITADSYAAAKSSPHLELLRKKGIEVLLLSDRIDEWMMSYLTEFDGKAFQSVAKADESLDKLADEVDESTKEAEKALEPFVERVKNLLGDRVKEVRLTHRLTDTPAIVTTDADEMSTQMAKLFAAAGQAAPEVKYIFELNPAHQLVKRAADTQVGEWVELLLDQALLAERGTLEDPNQFIRRMNQLLAS